MNAVDSLLTRLKLTQYIDVFRERNITNPKMLRALTDAEFAQLIADEQDREEFKKALSGGMVPVAAPQGHRESSYGEDGADYADHYEKRRHHGKGGKGGKNHHGDRHMYDNFSGGRGGGKKGGYHHHNNNYDRGDRGQNLEDAVPVENPDVLQVEVSIPTFTVAFLLANKAAKLNAINHKYGTTNSRINRPDTSDQSSETTFNLFGHPDVVEKAKCEIEKLVGIERRNKSEQRFQDALLGRTKTVTSLLYALNARRLTAGAETALKAETIPEHVSQFLFCSPYSHIQQFYVEVTEKPRSKVDTLGKILHAVDTCQALVFCSNHKHISELLMQRIKPEQLSGLKPKFLVPTMEKDEREEILKAFHDGTGPHDKITYERVKDKNEENKDKEYSVKDTKVDGFATDKNRLLVTSDDYARYARKNPIPYVSLVFCYDVPKTKESYLYRIGCAGRGGKRGVAITLISPNEKETISQLQRFGLQIQELPANFYEALECSTSDELLSV
eukprot:TRINITY_DN1703_c0_g1_i1.p1 TRINITY_DN1703_c0_g1~~TRINITY_DN1703_c0_g1_i1.p1  ORF type:complete len:516 (+),score=167.37 TRINITY_DN1703_c0_g1_i1:47-1549(+)